MGVSREVSTGIDLGSECRCREGVLVPGVEGGVKAGEIRFAGTVLPGEGGWESWRSDHPFRYVDEGRATGAMRGAACEGRELLCAIVET